MARRRNPCETDGKWVLAVLKGGLTALVNAGISRESDDSIRFFIFMIVVVVLLLLFGLLLFVFVRSTDWQRIFSN